MGGHLCAFSLMVNKFQILIFGGSQFVALSMDKPFLPPTTSMMMQETLFPTKYTDLYKELPDWDSLLSPDQANTSASRFKLLFVQFHEELF